MMTANFPGCNTLSLFTSPVARKACAVKSRVTEVLVESWFKSSWVGIFHRCIRASVLCFASASRKKIATILLHVFGASSLVEWLGVGWIPFLPHLRSFPWWSWILLLWSWWWQSKFSWCSFWVQVIHWRVDWHSKSNTSTMLMGICVFDARTKKIESGLHVCIMKYYTH